jgi:hypothetical protein
MYWRVERTSIGAWDERPPCEKAVVHRRYKDTNGWNCIEWQVEIPDLLAFLKEYGECIIRMGDDGMAEIEIYDSCRE